MNRFDDVYLDGTPKRAPVGATRLDEAGVNVLDEVAWAKKLAGLSRADSAPPARPRPSTNTTGQHLDYAGVDVLDEAAWQKKLAGFKDGGPC